MESSVQTHPMVRTAAWAVVLVALLPITMGAFVTTLDAGMAFLDWPSSDGQNMLLYPWLADLRTSPDKFVEHGHRLAGVLIGLCSILLVVVTRRLDQRRWVRWYAGGILLAVIGQGLLGGARVLLDRQTLAMLHSIAGSIFFTLCLLFLMTTGRHWSQLHTERDTRMSAMSFGLIMLLPLVVFGQYLLGSSLRHLHTMLDEHIAGAVVVAVLTIGSVVALVRSESSSMRRTGFLVLGALTLQILLGVGSFVTSLGFKPYGIVALRGGWAQVIVCSLHTVGGMLLLGASVLSAAVTLKLMNSGSLINVNLSADAVPVSPSKGGVR